MENSGTEIACINLRSMQYFDFKPWLFPTAFFINASTPKSGQHQNK